MDKLRDDKLRTDKLRADKLKADKLRADELYDCVVVGGGAAGMMAAITAARTGVSVCIVEHTKRLGSKILQTGNGKCNFTNLDMRAQMYNNDDKEFVNSVLDNFGVNDALSFFEELGVYYKSKNGYVYPHSEMAVSLQEALVLELDRLGVHILVNAELLCINKNAGLFAISYRSNEGADMNNYKLSARRVILATGSKAAPKTGSDGSGYKVAKSLGHKVKKPLPALVQLVSDCPYCKLMSGVRSIGKVEIYVDGKIIAFDEGEIQYTDYGISGIPVFQVSRYAVEAVDKGLFTQARIDMVPDISKEQLLSDIRKRVQRDGNKTVEQFFSGIINKKLVCAACREVGIDISVKVRKLSVDRLDLIVEALKNFCFNIIDFKGFENGQVCQGGVVLSQVNVRTMESLVCDGVFFAGEILDVDGKCGGYNLQWAWSSGYVAGKSVGEIK